MTTTHALHSLSKQTTRMEDYDPTAMSVMQAQQFIRQFLNPVIEVETLPLRESLGRVLAADIVSPAQVPNYDNAAMDGFAFHADDVNTSSLKVIGIAFAGTPFDGVVGLGQCVRIMTGAMMPQGTNTVVMQEHVRLEGDVIYLMSNPKPHANVREAGEDLKFGQAVLSASHRMLAADLGLIASLGVAEVCVYKPLKVAIFSTGDELVQLGKPLGVGQVYDSNRYTLFGMLKRLGVELIDLGAIADDPAMLEKTLLNAARLADVVITSGGVSVGEADYMKHLLTQHGQVMFWKINMKPGRPLAYGKIQYNTEKSAHYFGLPGNPVAVMVTFYQFVSAALITLMGGFAKPLPMFTVQCVQAIKKAAGRTEFQRGILFEDAGVWKVKPTGAQGSAILSSMSQANCFIVLAEEVGNLEAGTWVQVQVLEGVV
ncbi:MAG: molybdopterin molybdotransferase MoeA [Methylotenera sp.]|nr:molybdopterin molybdotransferase MoeA [Methylotenera sp.]